MQNFSEIEINNIINCLDNLYIKNENQESCFNYLYSIQTFENIQKIFNLLIQNQNQYMVLYLSNTLSILLKRFFIGLSEQEKINMLNILIEQIELNTNSQIQKQYIWLFGLITRLSFYDDNLKFKNLISNLFERKSNKNIFLNILSEICENFKDSSIPPIDKFNRIIYLFNNDLKYFIFEYLLKILSYQREEYYENILKCLKTLNSEIEEKDLNKNTMLKPIFYNISNKLNYSNICISVCHELLQNKNNINLEIIFQIILFNKEENEDIKKILVMILSENIENLDFIAKILAMTSDNISFNLNGDFYIRIMKFSIINFNLETITNVLKIILKLDWKNDNDIKIVKEYISTIVSKLPNNQNEFDEYILYDFIKIISKFTNILSYPEILLNYEGNIEKNLLLKLENEALKYINIINNLDLFCHILNNFFLNLSFFNPILKLKFIKYVLSLLNYKESTQNIFNYICQKLQITSPTDFICNILELLFKLFLENNKDLILCYKILMIIKKRLNDKLYDSNECGYLTINSEILLNTIENQIKEILSKNELQIKLKIKYLSLMFNMHLILNKTGINVISLFFQNDTFKRNPINYLIILISLIKEIKTTQNYIIYISELSNNIDIILNFQMDVNLYNLVLTLCKEITNNSLRRIDFRGNESFRDYNFFLMFQFFVNKVYNEIILNVKEEYLKMLFKIIDITSNIISSEKFITKFNDNDSEIFQIWEKINNIIDKFQFDILIGYNLNLKNFPTILKFLIKRKFQVPKIIPISQNILQMIYENLDSLNNTLSIQSYELLNLLDINYFNKNYNFFFNNRGTFIKIILKFIKIISNKEITKYEEISKSLSSLMEIFKNDEVLFKDSEFNKFQFLFYNSETKEFSVNSSIIKNNIINFLESKY